MTNIALVVLDTLRKDHFDKYFNWLPGASYDNAWSTSHWTVPAHASMLTGKYGSTVGTTKKSPQFAIDNDNWLPAQLQSLGYRTHAFSANAFLTWKFGFDTGFDAFDGSWRIRQIPRGDIFDWDSFIARHDDRGIERFPLALFECLRSDCDTLRSLRYGLDLKLNEYRSDRHADDGASGALELVRDTVFGEKEFLFMNLVEPHWPYDAPDEYRRVAPPNLRWLDATLADGYADPNQVRTAYEDEVRYLADVYKDLFSALKESFDVIITCSDHGESLGEKGVWQHWYGLPPEVTHVPISIYAPELTPSATTAPVSLLDIHQTIASRAGVDIESEGVDLIEYAGDDERTIGVEYHGLSSQHIEGMQQRDYNHTNYDRALFGVINKSGYHYETFEDTVGEDHDAIQAFAENHRVALPSAHEDLDEETLKQLQDLGYA